MFFPVADIYVSPIWPLLAGFVVSIICTPVGISGGFILLPVYVNIFHFTSPAVNPTNLIFNIISVPPGLLRLHREKRVMWGLGFLIFLAGIPGILCGTVIRCSWLKNPGDFKIFMAVVLVGLGTFVVKNILGHNQGEEAEKIFYKGFHHCGFKPVYGRKICYNFAGQTFYLSTFKLIVVSLLIGFIGGIYGIGGGAIIAPVLFAIFQMPLYAVNGASLLAGWCSAVFGLFSYMFFWPLVSGQAPVMPDIKLGLLFSIGGMLGGYVGAVNQKYVPALLLKILTLMMIIALIFLSL